MVDRAWQSFFDEIGRWRDAGRDVEFWWRDDDACRTHPALARLYALAAATGVPLALAVIPGAADAAAFDALPSCISVIQHGADHQNRASGGAKKTEFPADEPLDAALGRLLSARKQLEVVAGARMLSVLAPPWNRISMPLVAQLGKAGYLGISTFGVRKVTNPACGLRQVNTHVDIIDWKGGRGFVGDESALGQATRHLSAKRTGAVDALEPTGWLTHHAVHDTAAWGFLGRLFEGTQGASGVYWRSPRDVFGRGG